MIFFAEVLPLLTLLLIGLNTKPISVDTDEQHYLALSKTVYGFTICFLILLVIDTVKNYFF